MAQLKPADILDVTIKSGVVKADMKLGKMIILAVMAGAFIAVAGAGANMISYSFLAEPLTAGIGKMLSGFIFPAGLIMVVMAGSELFTGNSLMIASLLDRKITARAMLKNWIIVYIANFIGAILIAWIMVYSGLLDTGNGLLGEVTASIAESKVSMSFGSAFVRGILCNFLVCIAVWMANGADSTAGKVLCIFFPIWLFVATGFEHSIANMYFIPAGLFSGLAGSSLTWSRFLIDNLLPVTLGNIIGGGIFTAAAYYYAYKRA